jgi:hypothetical protein
MVYLHRIGFCLSGFFRILDFGIGLDFGTGLTGFLLVFQGYCESVFQDQDLVFQDQGLGLKSFRIRVQVFKSMDR